MKKYAIYCNTDNKWEHVLSTSVPTTCPTNAAHDVDSSRVVCVQEEVLVNDGTPVDASVSLEDYKKLRYNEINGKTWALIGAGFTFDSKTFGLSVFAMVAYEDLQSNFNKYTFPYPLSTLDNDLYMLASNQRDAFVDAARTTVQGHKESGNTLLKAVFDAVDRAGVDAVVDNR